MQCYKRILQLDPENIQGLHNLCVVYVERGELVRAEKCLARAHLMAPHEDYVLRHLKIVQTRIAKLQLNTDASDANAGELPVDSESQNLHKTIPDFSRRGNLDSSEDVRRAAESNSGRGEAVAQGKRINRRPAQPPVYVNNVPTGSTTKKVLRASLEYSEYPPDIQNPLEASDRDTPSFS